MSELILTAKQLKDIQVRSSKNVFEDEGDRYDLLKALKRVQKQLFLAAMEYHYLVCAKPTSANALRGVLSCQDVQCLENIQALRDTGGEVSDGQEP